MNNCKFCGRVRENKLNNHNWKRHTDACKLKPKNKRRIKNLSVANFFIKKSKINKGKIIFQVQY